MTPQKFGLFSPTEIGVSGGFPTPPTPSFWKFMVPLWKSPLSLASWWAQGGSPYNPPLSRFRVEVRSCFPLELLPWSFSCLGVGFYFWLFCFRDFEVVGSLTLRVFCLELYFKLFFPCFLGFVGSVGREVCFGVKGPVKFSRLLVVFPHF